MFRVGRLIVDASCAMCLGLRPASLFSLWVFARPCASSPSMDLTSIGCVERRVPARRFRRWFRSHRQLRLRESNVPGATVGASCPARPRGFISHPGLGRLRGTRSCAAISSVVPWSLAASAPRVRRSGGDGGRLVPRPPSRVHFASGLRPFV